MTSVLLIFPELYLNNVILVISFGHVDLRVFYGHKERWQEDTGVRECSQTSSNSINSCKNITVSIKIIFTILYYGKDIEL
ncbi:hypothetical protein KN1_11040 [Stygiolobus caldivivus]|uniref:Uncharacterized protein n=1 Tax=Stygiolobus caldivivus TaxID=2824673 RepID=A0A8D5U5U0_9CREN|nr:hypothetical protein KN1_11040 [Stygiolobus caldivivus]